MASGRRGGNGGGWRGLLDTLVVLFLVCVLMVVLVSSGAWRTLSDTFGVGDPNATTGELTEQQVMPGREPNAKTPQQWWESLFDRPDDPSSDGSTVSRPKEDPQARADTGSDASPAPSEPQPDTTGGQQSDDWSSTLNQLDAIPIAGARVGGYDRARYFGGWANSPQLCGSANMRDQILNRDLTDPISDRQCRVTSGVLKDPYTGEMIRFSRGEKTSGMVQVDHVVSLLDAWASGARDWSQAQREAYANDPRVLLAASGSANMAKGAGVDFNGTGRWVEQHSGAPDIWMPDDAGFRCEYARRRVDIKHEYRLSMTDREKRETIALITACRDAGQ